MAKKGLGRGLGALIPEVEVADHDREGIHTVETLRVRPNPNQPRKSFDQAKLDELAGSIREHGVVQPIVVRSRGDWFEIVAGERRWRAAQLAGLERIPVLVREFSEAEVMEIALIENLQREDLNPLEEAEAYRTLIEEFRLTQDELAKRLGRSRPQITNTLRLLQLSPVAREAVRKGQVSMGHAKVLLGVEDPATQGSMVSKVIEEGLSVRQLEDTLKVQEEAKPKGHRPLLRLSPDLAAIEEQLREHFGTPVKLLMGEQKGKIEVTVFGEDGLQRILELLGIGGQQALTAPKEPFRV